MKESTKKAFDTANRVTLGVFIFSVILVSLCLLVKYIVNTL